MVVWVSFIAGFTPFVILIAATFNKEAYWEIKKTDYLYGIVAILSMLLWYITKDPSSALLFALIADFAVGYPTLIKTYHYPKTES